jgi:hypothetical protein
MRLLNSQGLTVESEGWSIPARCDAKRVLLPGEEETDDTQPLVECEVISIHYPYVLKLLAGSPAPAASPARRVRAAGTSRIF